MLLNTRSFLKFRQGMHMTYPCLRIYCFWYFHLSSVFQLTALSLPFLNCLRISLEYLAVLDADSTTNILRAQSRSRAVIQYIEFKYLNLSFPIILLIGSDIESRFMKSGMSPQRGAVIPPVRWSTVPEIETRHPQSSSIMMQGLYK